MFDIMKNSRLYKFLRKIAGDDVSITPNNVLEDCLDDIADAVGEGGGMSVFTYADVTYAAVDTAYKAGKNVAVLMGSNLYTLDFVGSVQYRFAYSTTPGRVDYITLYNSGSKTLSGINEVAVLTEVPMLQNYLLAPEVGQTIQLDATTMGSHANYAGLYNFLWMIFNSGSFDGAGAALLFTNQYSSKIGQANLVSAMTIEEDGSTIRYCVFAFVPYVMTFTFNTVDTTTTLYYKYELLIS